MPAPECSAVACRIGRCVLSNDVPVRALPAKERRPKRSTHYGLPYAEHPGAGTGDGFLQPRHRSCSTLKTSLVLCLLGTLVPTTAATLAVTAAAAAAGPGPLSLPCNSMRPPSFFSPPTPSLCKMFGGGETFGYCFSAPLFLNPCEVSPPMPRSRRHTSTKNI